MKPLVCIQIPDFVHYPPVLQWISCRYDRLFAADIVCIVVEIPSQDFCDIPFFSFFLFD